MLALLVGTTPAAEELSPPTSVVVHQLEYGPTSTLIISWESAASYDAVKLFVDGEAADGEADGAANVARVQAVPGEHEFGVMGVVGEKTSSPAVATFVVLDASPITEPIRNLTCEFLPEQGGRLVLRWEPGAEEWVAGRVQLPRLKAIVEIEAGATEAIVAASPDGEPQVVELTFRNADNYYSPFYTPLCTARLPTFLRGDCDGNSRLNITDPIYTLNHLFRGGERWFCDDACDANDDGELNISDPIALLNYLFASGRPPAFPGPRECGPDLTPDLLGGICICPLD
jgi:hypothetical protein